MRLLARIIDAIKPRPRIAASIDRVCVAADRLKEEVEQPPDGLRLALQHFAERL